MTIDLDEQTDRTCGDPLSVLIADSHLLVAESIGSILTEKRHCRTVGVDTLAAAIDAARGSHYDMIFYDCGLPDDNGIETVRQLVSDFPESAIILFAKCSDNNYLTAALKAGLRGYVPKSMPLRSLLPTIDLLKTGEIFIPAQIMRELRLHAATAPSIKRRLPSRDIELLRLIETGLSNKEIGQAVGATENQVKMRLRALYQRIGARSRMQALNISKELGAI